MKKITLLNHSSVLIQFKNNYILTDPWHLSPSFGSWLPCPPMLYNPSYLLALAKSTDNFFILVSHGHDDHCDDKFISLLAPHSRCLIPKYNSKGFKKRIEKNNFVDVCEFGRDGLAIGEFFLKSYIFKDFSHDDALVTISTSDFIIAHANDNWQPFDEHVREEIKKDFAKHNKQNTLFMCQTNLADGFPIIYDNYTDTQKANISKTRQDRIIISGVKNSLDIGSQAFLSYAGMAIPFIKNRGELLSISCPSSPKGPQYIKTLLKNKSIEDNVLEMIPGDSYDFEKIQKLFNSDINFYDLLESSITYHQHYGNHQLCDTFKDRTNKISKQKKKDQLSKFLREFKKFVLQGLPRKGNFQKHVLNINFSFQDEEVIEHCIFSKNNDCDVKFIFPNNILERILFGKINWENCYIGYQSTVIVNTDQNIGSLIRWLSMFGYYYQNSKYFFKRGDA